VSHAEQLDEALEDEADEEDAVVVAETLDGWLVDVWVFDVWVVLSSLLDCFLFSESSGLLGSGPLGSSPGSRPGNPGGSITIPGGQNEIWSLKSVLSLQIELQMTRKRF